MKFIFLIFISVLSLFIQYVWCAPNLRVNTAVRHAISPYIYGINFADDIGPAFAKEIRVPVNRWGGNSATRYNWKVDALNIANDYFFSSSVTKLAHPEKLPDGSSSDQFVERNHLSGSQSLIQLPMIGWTEKDREQHCSFSVKKYGPQQKIDQWNHDCGNGIKPDGKPITGNDPHDANIQIGPPFVKEWVQHLVRKYGPASKGGVMFYALDNEYDLWQGTHRDVHPHPVSADEYVTLSQQYGAVVKEADPSSQIIGLSGWGYSSLLSSGLDQYGNTGGADRKKHGNIPFAEYYLRQMHAYEQQHKVRILDYLDTHYYSHSDNEGTDPASNAARLRSTRSLWDPTYVDESWIGQAFKDGGYNKIELIPRMRKMCYDNYPGTKTAITEYQFGAFNTLNGAIAQADVLGIFGREGLDLATFWSYTLKDNQPWAYAFRMYRNYDGKGSHFGDTGVSATSDDQSKLAIYASLRYDNKELYLMVINKDLNQNFNSQVSIAGFTHTGNGHVFRYSNENLNKIVAHPDQVVSDQGFTAAFPAHSITLIVIPGHL